MFSKRRKNFMENFFITSIFCFYQNSKTFGNLFTGNPERHLDFQTLFILFSKNHTNINKSTINHETNATWFIESNRQEIEFTYEIIVTTVFVCIKKEIKSF